ncbi:MAG: molybdopterin-dependent oxidoreductase, partial [Armatimonadota bacterium]|nr:molybdopterin-dependent oxidoreductase [Armatimonadota bacterium]
GGTNSYREMEETNLILLWGSNARETHPVMFLHMLKGVRNGARLVVVDPRRTSSVAFAHRWLPVRVGTDIALANAMGRYIIHEGLLNEEFVREATEGFARYREAVEPYTLERAEAITGVPRELIAATAREYATAPRAMICWTLGITEHHNAVDTVFSLTNLALLTGHVGRYGSGLNPLRGQNNVQGGGDMGALPNRLVGFQNVEDPEVRARFERAWGCTIPPKAGWHLTAMYDAMEKGLLRGLYVIGENPVCSDANATRILRLFQELEFLVVQDLFLTPTAELANVVFPAAAAWCESEGTVTSSERRVQRVRKALDPPGEARDDLWILQQLARRLGREWDYPDAEAVWNEVRELSPLHRGMSYRRLEELGGIQWPCPTEDHPGELFLHGRLWKRPVEGPRAPFVPTHYEPPVDEVNEDYPLLLTTGRRLYFFNTGVQTALYGAPVPQEEYLVLHPRDAGRYGIAHGDRVRVSSRRGSVEATAWVESTVAPGLCFMTLHFPEKTPTNVLTVDAADPKSGTAEFKATAVRVERIPRERVPAEATREGAP